MYHNILVALDESSVGMLALKEAIKIAQSQKNAVIRLVHIIDQNVWIYGTIDFNFSELLNEMKKHGEKIIKHHADALQKQNIPLKTALIELEPGTDDSIANKILHEVHDSKADLLVMGTHGRNGLNRFFLGSVAEEVIRQATIPVLLVRNPDSK